MYVWRGMAGILTFIVFPKIHKNRNILCNTEDSNKYLEIDDTFVLDILEHTGKIQWKVIVESY